jgi:hypothetical protein
MFCLAAREWSPIGIIIEPIMTEYSISAHIEPVEKKEKIDSRTLLMSFIGLDSFITIRM